MKKKKFSTYLFIFLLISGVQVASAVSVIPPIEVSFSGEADQSMSRVINIQSIDYSGEIEVSDSWAERGVMERKPTIHNKTASQLGITIKYGRTFQIVKDMTYGFTIILETSVPGMYHGMISFKPVDARETLIPVTGTWIKVDTRGIILNQLPSLTNQRNITINGNASTDLKDIGLYVNKNPAVKVNVTENGKFSANVTLREGSNEIFAKGESTIDKKAMQSNKVKIILDTVPPEAPTIFPLPALVNTSRITISGNAEANSLFTYS